MKLRASFYFFILLQSFAMISFAQRPDLRFNHLSVADGLSQNRVQCILKDSKGFMWFGTRDGLNRYDGYNFTIFKNNSQNPASISSSYICDIFEDKEGSLWIGTRVGLDRYDRKKNTFVHYYTPDSTAINIRDIYQDSKSRMWVATANEGLLLFNPSDGSFKAFTHNKQNEQSVSSNEVNKIVEFSEDVLWVVTRYGLDVFDVKNESFKHMRPDPARPEGIGSDRIRDIFKDSKGNIWLSYYRKGLALYNVKENSFSEFLHNPEDPNSLPEPFILAITEGPDGKIWLGLENKGLALFDHKKDLFYSYESDSYDAYSLGHHFVQTIYRDNSGNMWLGTQAAGVDFYTRAGKKFVHYTQIPGNKNSLSNKNVYSIVEDSQGKVWIATDGGGLNKFDRNTNTFMHYRAADERTGSNISSDYVYSVAEIEKGKLGLGYNRDGGFDFFNPAANTFTHHLPEGSKTDTSTIAGKTISCIVKDHENNLWIGSWGAGLNFYNSKTKSFFKYKSGPDKPHGISHNVIFAVYEDKARRIWVGTEDGLNLFDKQKKEFVHFKHDSKNKQSISNNIVNCLLEDNRGNFWVGTNSGLNLMDRKNNTFITFNEADGLPNESIKGMLEDDHGNIWISTNKGIARFTPETKMFKVYDVSDGLQAEEFTLGACYKNKNGEMYFGGINGFNIFHPDSLIENTYIPPVVISDFQIFNKAVSIGEEDSPLTQHISETKELVLSYTQSVFSFAYAGLNFVNPHKNKYAYKLEGFDKDWNYVDGQRKATYTNINPGEYLFKVKASNNDGKWNEAGTFLKIIITPPYYQTWWFKTLLGLTVIGGALTFYKARMNAVKVQKNELEKQVKERTAEVVKQKEALELQAESLRTMNGELQEKQEEILQQQEEMQAQADQLMKTNGDLLESQQQIAIQRDNLEKINEQVMSSIQYAQTIQKAILPSTQKISQVFPEHFILYRPKDVVSGDFYWFAHLPKEESGLPADLNFIAVVDCTGHGVPGAFMSIIGNTILNEIVNQKQVTEPATILELLNEGIKQAVEKTEGMNTAGMDVCLCLLEKSDDNTVKVQFSGAKRNLLFVRAGSKRIEKLVADRRSIGSTSAIPFTTQNLILDSGSMLYLTSDGYTDQNNPAREKLGSTRLYETIKSVSGLAPAEQRTVFEQVLDEHQKDSEQRDDITLFGLKV